ncbi:MAG: translation initiation factor IF-6 [archaeon]
MHIFQTNLNGNPNIGLFCFCNDKFCLVPFGTQAFVKAKFEEALKVPVYEISIAGTTLIGALVAGNSHGIIIPSITFKNEIMLLDKYKIKYTIIDTKFTAFGNNVLCNDHCCVLSCDYDAATMKEIEKALGVPVMHGKIAALDTVGAIARLSNENGLVHSEAQVDEIKFLEKNLKITAEKGSVNYGSPYISSSLLCNSHGFIIGESTSGPEIANADEALGFLKG